MASVMCWMPAGRATLGATQCHFGHSPFVETGRCVSSDSRGGEIDSHKRGSKGLATIFNLRKSHSRELGSNCLFSLLISFRSPAFPWPEPARHWTTRELVPKSPLLRGDRRVERQVAL